jgi:hypothetical protein
VLEVNSGAVRMAKAEGGPNQKWFFEDDGTIRSNLGLVLDVYGFNKNAWASVIVARRHGKWNQLFQTVLITE